MNTNETVSHIYAGSSEPDIPNPGSFTTHRTPPPRFRGSRRYETRLRYFKLLGSAAGVTALVLLVIAKFAIEGLESENQILAVKTRKQAIQLEESQVQLKKLRQDIGVLVEGRIPDLHRLEFDKTISLDREYVRDIIFTLTGVGAEKKYEYRVVLHNDSLNTAYPLVNVFIFDKLGIQLGMTGNSRSDAFPTTELITLQPGEIRSYSSTVPLDRNETPVYFLVTTD